MRQLSREIVTRDSSTEWGDVWGYLPDPDPVLTKSGLDVLVFDQLLSDAHVFACYQSRKAGVLTGNYKIEYPKGSEKIAKLLDPVLKDLFLEELISQFLDAPFYGFSVNEVLWEQRKGKWIPTAVIQKPNDWFVFDKWNQVRFLSKGNEFEGQLLPPYKFLVPRNFPTFKNPYGLRLLSRCFWPVAFKKTGYKYWAMFMEKFGVPWIIGKVPRGTSLEERQTMLDQLVEMVQNAVAVINDDESVEAVDLRSKGAGSTEHNVFATMVDSANGEISKAILTQTLTTEVGTKGAYAATQSHLSVRNDLCAMDRKLVATSFSTLFKWFCELNFPDLKAIPYFKFVEEEDAHEPHARRDSQLYSQGVRFDEEYYVRTYNLRSGEFRIEEPEPMVSGKPADENGPPAQTQPEKDQMRKEKRLKKRQDPDEKKKEGDKDAP